VRVELLTTSNSRVRMDIKGEGTFLEIQRKVGEVERNGRKVPVFFKDGISDARVAKLTVSELSTLLRGLRRFIDLGIGGFKEYSKRITEKYENLLFCHDKTLVGLRAFRSEGREFIGFEIRDPEGNDAYGAYTSDLKTLEGVYQKLRFIVERAIEASVK